MDTIMHTIEVLAPGDDHVLFGFDTSSLPPPVQKGHYLNQISWKGLDGLEKAPVRVAKVVHGFWKHDEEKDIVWHKMVIHTEKDNEEPRD